MSAFKTGKYYLNIFGSYPAIFARFKECITVFAYAPLPLSGHVYIIAHSYFSCKFRVSICLFSVSVKNGFSSLQENVDSLLSYLYYPAGPSSQVIYL